MEPKGKLLAVAGASGNCGREVVRAAHQRGLRVRALVRDPSRLGPVRELCDEVRVVQVTQRETLFGALDGAHLLVSALGKTYQKDATPRRAVDVDANLDLFEEARQAGVERIGFVSVFLAGPDHPVEMVRMKWRAEEGLRTCGVPYVIVRPSGFFTDVWEMFRMAERGTLWVFGDGSGLFNPIALEDLGDFVVSAVLDDANVGRALGAGGEQALSFREIAEVAGRVIGRPVRVRSIPLWMAKVGVAAVRPFNHNAWELGQFFVGMADHMQRAGASALAPAVGSRRLEDYLRARYEKERRRR